MRRRLRRLAYNQNFWPIVQVCATAIAVVAMGVIVWIASTESSARKARVSADNRAAVTACFERNAQGPAAERFFHVLQVILENQVHSATAALETVQVTPENAKKFRHVIDRATLALDELRDFRATSLATTPTRAECRELAEKLDVRTER